MENLNALKERIFELNPDYTKLCSDFLILYSRFEFALKESGFLQPGNRVLASIKDYADSIKESFKPEQVTYLANAVNFIMETPPKVFLIRSGRLFWEDKIEEGNPIQVLPEYLRRVRNNLLHGGKFYGGIETGSRNLNLISNSMIIIDHWIDLNADVKQIFLKI